MSSSIQILRRSICAVSRSSVSTSTSTNIMNTSCVAAQSSTSTYAFHSLDQRRNFGRKLPPVKGTRIENKIGVGLRYRRPRVGKGVDTMDKDYSSDEVSNWRKQFDLPVKKQDINVAENMYSDEELVLWRKQFDAYAQGRDLLTLAQFQKMVKDKYDGMIEDKQIPGKVVKVFRDFDKDQNNTIDFGEFIDAGFLFDLQRLQEVVQTESPKAIFDKYANEGFLQESEIYNLMGDYNFFLSSTAEARKFMKAVDHDRDGMINQNDFDVWSESGTKMSA